MKEYSRKRRGWRYWRNAGAFTLAAGCIGVFVIMYTGRPHNLQREDADSNTPTPTMTPWIRMTVTPTRTPVVEGTPTPYCRPSEASISLFPSATELEVGQTITVVVRLVNGETSEAKLGWILYRLRRKPNTLVLESDEAVEHTLTLEPGDWDQAEFSLRAVEPGRVRLSGWASYEMHALDYSWGSNSGCFSRALEIVITP